MKKTAFKIVEIFLLGIICTTVGFGSPKNDSTTIIRGSFVSLHDTDTIELHIANDIDLFSEKSKVIKSDISSHLFEIVFDGGFVANRVKLLSATSLAGNSIYPFWVLVGDTITIFENKRNWKFEGDNSVFYNAQALIQTKFKEAEMLQLPVQLNDSLRYYFEMVDSVAKDCLRILNSKKNLISNEAYLLLKSEIILHFQGSRKVSSYFWNFGRNAISISDILRSYSNEIWNKETLKDLELSKTLRKSQTFASFLIDQYVFDSCILRDRSFDFETCYTDLEKSLDGELREAVLFNLLYSYNNRRDQRNAQKYIEHAILTQSISNKDYVKILNDLLRTVLPGSKAYNFTLPDNNGNLVQLKHFEGKVVLLDFWYSNCGPCAEIHPYIKKLYTRFKDEPFRIIAISIDKSVEVWKKSIKDGVRTSSDVINLYTDGSGDKSPIIEKYLVMGFPTLVLIDKKGFIIETAADPRRDSGEKLLLEVNKALSN